MKMRLTKLTLELMNCTFTDVRNVINIYSTSLSAFAFFFLFSEMKYQTLKTENNSFWNSSRDLKRLTLKECRRFGIPKPLPFLTPLLGK